MLYMVIIPICNTFLERLNLQHTFIVSHIHKSTHSALTARNNVIFHDLVIDSLSLDAKSFLYIRTPINKAYNKLYLTVYNMWYNKVWYNIYILLFLSLM